MNFHSTDSGVISLRRLRYAVVASLLLHVVLLWPATPRPTDAGNPLPLQASLRPSPHQAPVPKPVLPTPGAVRARAPDAAKVLAAPAAEQAPPLAPAPTVLATAAPAAKPAPRAAMDVASASPGAFAAARRGPPSPAGPGASPDVADGLRGYRIAVAREARRFKRYPSQATASGWEGSAEIALHVGPDGRPQPATLARSSGHEPLDRAALAMIDAGAQRARLPEALRGRSFAVMLPVVFDLNEQ